MKNPYRTVSNNIIVGCWFTFCIASLIEPYFCKAEAVPYSRRIIRSFICKAVFSGATM